MRSSTWGDRLRAALGAAEIEPDDEEIDAGALDAGHWQTAASILADRSLTDREAVRRAIRALERATRGSSRHEDAYAGVFSDPRHRDRNDE